MAANDGENQAIWPTDTGQGAATPRCRWRREPADGVSSGIARPRRPCRSRSASPYPPIADYAFLSDCEVTALIAPSSAIEWMCLPRMDSPSVFGAILDRDAGRFKFGPENISEPADRRYLPGTMVVETSWDCGEGWIIVRDCLLMGPWRHEHPGRSSHTRPPTDYDAEHTLLRTVRCVHGNAQLVMDCEPVFDYGRIRSNWRRTERGYYQAQITPEESDLTLTLTSDIRIGIEGPSARSRTLLHEGDTRFCALSWGSLDAAGGLRRGLPAPGLDRAPLAALARPRRLPRSPLAQLPGPQRADAQGPHLRADRARSPPRRPPRCRRRRAASGTGTTATAGSGTPRSRCGACSRSASTGRPATTSRSSPMWSSATGGTCRSSTASTAGSDLTEQTLKHLHGYQGAQPVRIGNDAYAQQQNDVWGVVLDSLYLHTRSRDRLDERVWQMARHQVEHALEHWREPDRGIWEVRGEPQHFTSSKLMCWVAADRGARLARIREDPTRRAAGSRRPTRSTPTSARTRWTTAASSASTTRRPRWTRRCC